MQKRGKIEAGAIKWMSIASELRRRARSAKNTRPANIGIMSVTAGYGMFTNEGIG
jgi:hypothetical protein